MIIGILAVTLLASGDFAEHFEQRSEVWWVTGIAPHVLKEPAANSAQIGQLRPGDPVQLLGCMPSCSDPDGWAWISPRGAVRLAQLSPKQPVATPAADADFLYGHVTRGGAPVRAAPTGQSKVARTVPRGRVLAFIDDEPLLQQGWLRSARDGYIDASTVKISPPRSSLAGVANPPPNLGFLLEKATATPPEAPPIPLERHSSHAVVAVDRDRVQFNEGWVPRSTVRLAVQQPRPVEIPEDAHWVYVDLSEQTLTAYEGDREVFATLVSTGKSGFRTPTGTYRVWQKARHFSMSGETYHIEQVPNVMFFNRGIALHSSLWHDSFGHSVSHGCVNLSPRDAAWLFEWAPPRVPKGWHLTMPESDEDSLWVVVSKSGSKLAPLGGTRPLNVARAVAN